MLFQVDRVSLPPARVRVAGVTYHPPLEVLGDASEPVNNAPALTIDGSAGSVVCRIEAGPA